MDSAIWESEYRGFDIGSRLQRAVLRVEFALASVLEFPANRGIGIEGRTDAAGADGERDGRNSNDEADREYLNQQAENILDEHGDSILRLAYSYLHNMADAEDILQDTIIQFLKTAPKFENRIHEKAWLLRTAGNLSKNRIEHNKVRESDELSEELVAVEREDLGYVWDAVRLLPAKYSEVIHLFYHEGYSTAEIANILGEKESTVRSHLKRGREKLRGVLKEVYDFE